MFSTKRCFEKRNKNDKSPCSLKKCDGPSIWAFCLRMREMNGIFEFGAICLNAYALRRVFKWVIYVARKILSREMKDYNKFTHISNTVDIHFVCRDFG